MAVLIDPPTWPAHDRLWSHLVSDTSLAELHAFAAAAGIPARGFEGDHYDVPAAHYDDLVAAGAEPVSSRELLRRLVASGLRVPKRRSERVLSSGEDEQWRAAVGPHRVDVIASRLGTPEESTVGGWVIALDPAGRVLLTSSPDRGWGLPGTGKRGAESAAGSVVRALAHQTGLELDPARLVPVGYQRLRLHAEPPRNWPFPAPWSFQALFTADVDPAGSRGDWVDLEQARTRVGHRRWWPVAERVLASRASGV